jgi:hypothetical protein
MRSNAGKTRRTEFSVIDCEGAAGIDRDAPVEIFPVTSPASQCSNSCTHAIVCAKRRPISRSIRPCNLTLMSKDDGRAAFGRQSGTILQCTRYRVPSPYSPPRRGQSFVAISSNFRVLSGCLGVGYPVAGYFPFCLHFEETRWPEALLQMVETPY